MAEKKQGEQKIVEEKTQGEPKMVAEKTQDEPKIAAEKKQGEEMVVEENTENEKNIVEEEVTQEKSEKNTETFKLLTVSAYVKDVSDGSLDILSDPSKKEQFDKMKDDLEVKKLERDVELVLDSRLRVNSTKERIKNLKHILHLLSKYSDDEDEQKKTTIEKETQTERKDNNTNQDKEKEIVENDEQDIEAKPEYVKDENLPDKNEKKNDVEAVDPEITENKPEEISKSQDQEIDNCQGITWIHRSPSRPSHPYGRQPHSLIFMSTLYKATCCLPAQQLTSDHEPACMCHLYHLRINTHVLTMRLSAIWMARP